MLHPRRARSLGAAAGDALDTLVDKVRDVASIVDENEEPMNSRALSGTRTRLKSGVPVKMTGSWLCRSCRGVRGETRPAPRRLQAQKCGARGTSRCRGPRVELAE